MTRMILILALLCSPLPAVAQTQQGQEKPMTMERLAHIIETVDPDAVRQGNFIEFTLADIPVMVVADPGADRMRAMVPIRSVSDMDEADFRRVLQANFDTALDARYAIAQGKLWGVFIHPLSPLERNELISGIGQSVNLALSYGTAYSSGAVSFGAGDSGPILRDLIDRLLDKGQAL